LLARHWQQHAIEPAAPAGDAELLRRMTLDLTGRIPTPEELDGFLADKSADRRRKAVQRLLAGPEFPLHFGRVLDEMIQAGESGNAAFVDYLRRSLRQRKAWDALFREILVGPWDSDAARPAAAFLDRRAKTPDVLTVDATRVFFGVDISCAQCHDHPLVSDWSQDHYYGMVSFFHRTTGGKGNIGEKQEGDVTFLSQGEQKTAKVMFLSGRVVDEPAAEAKDDRGRRKPISRRAQLVDVALEERTFFSRAIVNRLWDYFFGRGLVAPVDQMHSENPPSVPGLLEWLADDFAAAGYDLQRLVEALVSTQAYQLSSRWEQSAPLPDAGHFAVARLRPLSRQQMAVSLLLATGGATLSSPAEMDRRIENLTGVSGLSRIQQRLELDDRAAAFTGRIDPRVSDFQSSATEALFLSNAPEVQALFAARDNNLAARLAATGDLSTLVRTAVRGVLSRPAEQSEVDQLAAWLAAFGDDRQSACEALVWALASSAEFRFIP
jgi:hypothetical protein